MSATCQKRTLTCPRGSYAVFRETADGGNSECLKCWETLQSVTRCHASPRLWTRKKELARLLTRDLEVVVDGLARMLSQLKPNGSPGLSLTHHCPISCVTIGSTACNRSAALPSPDLPPSKWCMASPTKERTHHERNPARRRLRQKSRAGANVRFWHKADID